MRTLYVCVVGCQMKFKVIIVSEKRVESSIISANDESLMIEMMLLPKKNVAFS